MRNKQAARKFPLPTFSRGWEFFAPIILLLLLSPGMAYCNDLWLAFEPGSSRLPASQYLLLDDFVRNLQGQMIKEISIEVPASNDIGQQRFIRSRLATIDREIEKRGGHPNHVLGGNFVIGNDQILIHQVGTTTSHPQELAGWNLLGALPGRAWIRDKNGIVEVREGDIHPVLGRIERIWHDNGRWIVNSSKGWFQGGAS